MKSIKDTFEEYYMPYEKPCNNKKGFKIAYQYIGPWYVYSIEKEKLICCKRIFGMSCVFSTICFFTASLQDYALNYVTYPMLFAMLSLAALLFEWVGVVWFCLTKEKMTKQSFDEMHTILKIAPLFHMVLLLCSVAACIVMIYTESLSIKALIVPILYFISSMLSFVIFKIYRMLPFEMLKNEETTHM